MAANAKLERLLNLVAELIQTERPLSASEIRARLNAYPADDDSFKRAFERDKDALREMSIPLEMADDPVSGEIGYFIDRNTYGLPDPDLAPDERAALHLAATAVRIDGTDVTAGMQKLGGVAAAGALPPRMAVLPSAPQLGELLDAVSSRRRVEFVHRDKQRTVDPFQLLVDRGHWYLRAWDVEAEGVRSFRVDRIVGAVRSGDPGSALQRIDPDEHPAELAAWSIGDGDAFEVVVRVRPERALVAERVVGNGGQIVDNADGSVDIRLPVRNLDGLRGFVLGFLGDAEVIEPAWVRDDIVAWLRAMAGEEDGI